MPHSILMRHAFVSDRRMGPKKSGSIFYSTLEPLVQAHALVAPLKSLPIFRLEILACLLGVRLINSVKEEVPFEQISNSYWTESINLILKQYTK